MGYPHYSGDCYQCWPTVTICGSMRFYREMLHVAEELTLNGEIVLMPFVVKRAADGNTAHPPEVAASLDDLHKRKIDLSKRIVVVSDGTGYYGDSTKSEIEFATQQYKPVEYRWVEHADYPL